MSTINLILSTTSALIGGGLGSLVTYQITKPKLSIKISECLVDTPQPDIDDNTKPAIAKDILKAKGRALISVPSKLHKLSKDCIYVDTLSRFYQHPTSYTYDLLLMNKDSLSIKNTHKEIPEVIKELKLYLNSDMLDSFMTTWEPFDKVFWTQIVLAKRNNKFKLDVKEKIEELKPKFSLYQTSDDGNFFVLAGGKRIEFNWTIAKDEKDTIFPFSQTVSQVFAYGLKKHLIEILDFLESVTWDDPMIDKLEKGIDEELLKYNKIIIRGVIANSGRTPMSISGKGKIRLKSKGFEYNSDANVKRVEDDISVNIEVMKENLIENELTVIIPAGTAVSFEAHSSHYLNQLPDNMDIRALYGTEREVELEFKRIDNGKIINSSSTRFCEFKPDEVFR